MQWDNYAVEADLRFDSVLNAARWASLMFRGAADGKQPYNQMAIRQNGTYEVAYRTPSNSWSVMASGTSPALDIGSEYTLKVRVFGQNVKEYIKEAGDEDYTLLIDRSFTKDLLKRGKIGFQADQSSVSFDNLKVTRIEAEELELDVPESLEALTGPITVTGEVYYSDGITEALPMDAVKLYSSDESIVRVSEGKLYPLKAGTATLTAVYANAQLSRQVTVTPSAGGIQMTTLRHEEGYALAQTGQAIEPSELIFTAEYNDFSTGEITGDELEWTSLDGKAAIEDGRIVPLQKGVIAVTGQRDGAAVELLLVVKDETDSEYVLYENDFDNEAEGALPAGWTRKEGSTASKAVIKDGAFELDAASSPDNPSRVLLPSYLNLFGDYKIEADVMHAAVNESTRWNSIMFRIQGQDYPYYQMAVRQGATAVNGVEFAERTPGNAWSVLNRSAYAENMSTDRMYRYTVKAHGSRIQEYIDGTLVIDTGSAGTYLKGGIGLQANGGRMKMDNLRVTLQLDELPPLPEERFVEVAQPDTGIVMAPSIITEVGSKEELDALNGSELPATVILHVNKELNVTAENGESVAMSLAEALEAIGTRMMPAFYVRDEETVDALVAYLKSAWLEDAFIVSDNGELVKRGRDAYPIIRGIVDFGSAPADSAEDLMKIREAATLSRAKIAILPQFAATIEQVAYLQQRLVVVWTEADKKSGEEAYLDMHRMIHTGTNGIITDSPETAFQALGVYDHAVTLIRKPYIIGHRGMPSVAPENTIISNKLAIDAGADFIENDIYLSKDGHLVIIHDSVVDSTTDGTGAVESFTLEELRRLNVDQVPGGAVYPEARIATLEEQIDLARERGVMIYAEIKTSTPEAVDAFVKLVREKHAEDLVNVMSFSTAQLARLAELMPEMPLGLLTGGYANETNVKNALRESFKTLQPLDSTLNTSYGGLGPKFMEAAHVRGLLVSPWTYNNEEDYKNIFMLGAYGITTDYAYWSKDWSIKLTPEKESYELRIGDEIELSAAAQSYDREETAVAPSVVLLQDNGVVNVDGARLTAEKAGTAYVLLRHTDSIDEARSYDLYTQPVLIEVKEEDEDDNGDGDGDGNGGNDGDNGNGDGDGDGGNDDDSGNGDGEGNGGDDDDNGNGNGNGGSHNGNGNGNGSGNGNNGSGLTSGNEGEQPAGPTFTDIGGHWAAASIGRLAAERIMTGYPDGAFKPDLSMNRAEFVTVVSRMLRLDAAVPAEGYSDVASGAWYAPYIYSARQAGLVNGFEDGSFKPEQAITREEAVVILQRAFGGLLGGSSEGDYSFSDSDGISAWSAEAVAAMTAVEVLSGYPDGTFKPKADITRAEVASILAKLLDKTAV